ncbi:MAG: MMPL family transporter [Caulobacteraceae bacterium]
MTSSSTDSFLIARWAAACCDRAWPVVIGVAAVALAALVFVVTHFELNSDTEGLLSPKLAYRQQMAAFDKLFNPDGDQIVVVIDGKTPELAAGAAKALTDRLGGKSNLIRKVEQPEAGFFAREGLLFLSAADVRNQMSQLVAAQPFLGPLAEDPSLRGLMTTLSTTLTGVTSGQAKLADLNKPITALAATLGDVQAGRPAFFSWSALISGKPASPSTLRRLVLVTPVLDFSSLQSGSRASDFVRASAHELGLDPAHGVTVRLTGPIPLQDERFGSISRGAGFIAAMALTAILVMLWMAVRSPKLIAAILLTMLIGLMAASACGLLIFQRFNVISVAFIPLFVGLGIDFGIQVSVRFQAEHQPGVAVLTFLPAVIFLLKPAARSGGGAESQLARLDGFILSHRRWVLGISLAVAVACLALLPFLRFDFDPFHLEDTRAEAVSATLDLLRDPDLSPNSLDVIAPSLPAAQTLAARMRTLPEVADTRTLASFVPDDQAPKLAAINDAQELLGLSLDPLAVDPAPSDAETVASLRKTSADLRGASNGLAGPTANAARRLADQLTWLATAPPEARVRAQQALIPGLVTLLDETRDALQAQPVTLQTLPPEVVRDWLTPDGRARVQIAPKGDSNDNAVLQRFIEATRKISPDVTGDPIGILEGGRTIAGAFLEAGVLSFVAITVLLFLVLRRPRYVAITMAPIVLTGLLTLGTTVVLGRPLNYVNIIALPLLFGIGVAFHIYFVMAWRSGNAHLLQSSLTRAIFFSALATATGFGSLWASRHPGTASMGELLMISLIWTLVSALLFQPALMGAPDGQRT